jgi:hypothetical protein
VDQFLDEAIQLRSPEFADVFVRREPDKCFETTHVVLNIMEIAEVYAEWVMAFHV